MTDICFAIGLIEIIKVKMKFLKHFLDKALKRRKYGDRFYVVRRTMDGLGYVIAVKAMDQRHFENDDDMAREWKLLMDYNKFKGERKPKVSTRYRTNFFNALVPSDPRRRVFPGGNVQSLNKDRVLTEYGFKPKDHYRYFLFSWDNAKLRPIWPIGPDDVDDSAGTQSLDKINESHNLIYVVPCYYLQSNSWSILQIATNSTEHVSENSNASLGIMEISEPLPPTFEGEGGSVDSSTSSEVDDDLWTEDTSPQRSSAENELSLYQHCHVTTESGDNENIYSTTSEMNGRSVQRFSKEENGVEPDMTQSINQSSTDEEYVDSTATFEMLDERGKEFTFKSFRAKENDFNFYVSTEPGMTRVKEFFTNDEGYFDSMNMTLSEEGAAFEHFHEKENDLKLDAEHQFFPFVPPNFHKNQDNHAQPASDTIFMGYPDADNDSNSKVELPSNEHREKFKNAFPSKYNSFHCDH